MGDITNSSAIKLKSRLSLSKIAKTNFEKWNNALLTKDAKVVDSLYSKNATFLPTLSPVFEKGQEGADDYFKHFLEKNPFGKVVVESEQIIGPDCYVHSGMYNFEVGPEDDREIVEARFTFVWERDDKGEWRIIHHHSSLKPK